MRTVQLTLGAAAAAIILALSPASSQARTFVSVGFGFGGPYYGGWGWGPGWGYYRPYPYYYGVYAPPPVVYAPPPPVVVQQPAVVAPAAPVAPVAPAAPIAPSAPAPTYRAASPAVTEVSTAPGGAGIDQQLQALSNPNENVRQSAVMDLGRARVDAAVDPLCATLAGDASPSVRDAAARALGLIAAPRSLPALIRAAQADNDRDVRHSAQFAVEIIRTNLRNR